MKITTIIGNQRKDSESQKIATYIDKKLIQLGINPESSSINLATNQLPFVDMEQNTSRSPFWQDINTQLETSDGFVIIAPEWHGMVPASLKNFFLYVGSSAAMAHKPALIVAISASRGGAFVVDELRISSYKNSRLNYLPEHLIIRNVESVMNQDVEKNNPKLDTYITDRLNKNLRLLSEYAKAFRQIRNSGIDFSSFGNGMS